MAKETVIRSDPALRNVLYPVGNPNVRWNGARYDGSADEIRGPKGMGIAAYRSPFIPPVGAAGPVLFGARSRVSF